MNAKKQFPNYDFILFGKGAISTNMAQSSFHPGPQNTDIETF